MVFLEDGPVMPPRLRHHLDTEPVCQQNVECPGTHSTPHQYIRTEVPVQGVSGLAHVKEYVTEEHLPHGNELPKQILLKGGSPRSSTRVKAMQSVMELDIR